MFNNPKNPNKEMKINSFFKSEFNDSIDENINFKRIEERFENEEGKIKNFNIVKNIKNSMIEKIDNNLNNFKNVNNDYNDNNVNNDDSNCNCNQNYKIKKKSNEKNT
jgi:hypothetical protein